MKNIGHCIGPTVDLNEMPTTVCIRDTPSWATNNMTLLTILLTWLVKAYDWPFPSKDNAQLVKSFDTSTKLDTTPSTVSLIAQALNISLEIVPTVSPKHVS